jgi:hypothetical protein
LQRLQLQKPVYKPYLRMRGDQVTYNETLRRDLAAAIAAEGVSEIVCCIGGGVHTVVGLVQDPRPFDLLLPGATVDNTVPGTDLLPYDLVAASLRDRSRQHDQLLRLVKQLAGDRPVWQLCPPPPLARDELLLSRPAGFADELNERGLAPSSLRWKLWRTSCDVLKEVCAEVGITCLDVPQESLDHDGFLREDLWGQDPTHGNEHYGVLVIEQLISEVIGVPA